MIASASSSSARRRAAESPPLCVRDACERAVVEGVIEDHMAVGGHAADQVWIGFGPLAGNAKTGDDVLTLQDVQDVLGVAAVGAGVERQRHGAGGGVGYRPAPRLPVAAATAGVAAATAGVCTTALVGDGTADAAAWPGVGVRLGPLVGAGVGRARTAVGAATGAAVAVAAERWTTAAGVGG